MVRTFLNIGQIMDSAIQFQGEEGEVQCLLKWSVQLKTDSDWQLGEQWEQQYFIVKG